MSEAAAVAVLDSDTTPEDLEALRRLARRLRTTKDEIDERVAHLAEAEQRLDALGSPPPLVRFRGASWPARVSSAFVLTLIVTNLLSAEPPVAIGILVTLAVLTIPVVRRSVRIFPDYALLAVAFVFTCILIGAALFPPRFPHAIAQLENGTQVQGGLIAHDGGAWYVTTKRHRYVAIEDSMISKPVRVTSARRSRLKPVAAYIWNSITEDAICGMTPGRPSSACSGRHSARTSRRAA